MIVMKLMISYANTAQDPNAFHAAVPSTHFCFCYIFMLMFNVY
jgi:hypothetical protein